MINLLLAIIYMAFISLGLPDALLGSAWPSMYPMFHVPLSYAGVISMIMSACTVISSLQSDRLTKKLGTGLVTTLSVAMTAVALFGFSISSEFWMLCLWAIPYGLGAGSVDASLNNYVALHYESRHMNWLHCMWGVGISVGPYIMSFALTRGMRWNQGYRVVFLLQIILTIILIFSLPLWKKRTDGTEAVTSEVEAKPLSIREILAIPGAKEIMLTFFCYCALEQTSVLWGSSYMVLHLGITGELAASFTSLFCIGITIGRAISGFMTMKFTDTQMIRIGMGIILVGVLAILAPIGAGSTLAGLALVGFGCAPIYPCVIHSTPRHFGTGRSQAVIGVQMASAYIGTTVMPPLFGVMSNTVGIWIFPVCLGILLLLMFVMHEKLLKVTR